MTVDARPGFLPVDAYLDLPRDRNTWLLKPLIPVSGAALLYGQEKTGKSAIAVQMAAAMSGAATSWMGFPVVKTGPTLYLQLDNPRSTWAHRFEALKKGGLKYTPNLLLADRECLDIYPFDVLQPSHVQYLHNIVQIHQPVAVFVDTLREAHSGDEDSSTTARNVIINLVGATHPAALIIISHSRKPHPDADRDLMADHRGSSYITGRMDAILRMTKQRMYFGGRSIEEGNIKLNRMEVDGALMFEEANDEHEKTAIIKVLTDSALPSLRAKAKALAIMTAITEECAMSRLRRATSGDMK
jgi:hypothetical protein